MKHKPRKRFGQNFLTDDIVIRQLIDSMSVTPQDHIIEIGPGQAAITQHLINKCAQLSVIEIDRELAENLALRFENTQISIHNQDALKFNFKAIEPKPFRVVGNLPYNISTPLLIHLFSNIDSIIDMHIMLQKELVTRICSLPGEKNYGRLSVMVQYFCNPQPILDIPPSAFYPEPQVNSSFMRLTPRKNRETIDIQAFENLVRSAFNARRKTIANNLKHILTKEHIKSVGIDPSLRPEQLGFKEYIALTQI